MNHERILSIIPAQGWWAINPTTGHVTRLSMFALAEENTGSQRIVGLDNCLAYRPLDFTPETDGTDEYVYLGETPTAEAIEVELQRIRNEITESCRRTAYDQRP